MSLYAEQWRKDEGRTHSVGRGTLLTVFACKHNALTFSESWLSKLLYNWGARLHSLPGDDLSSELLDPFNFSDKALVVRIPDTGSVFQDW